MREAAGILIVAKDTCSLLLVRRSSRVSHPGEWGIPGGGFEPSDRGVKRTALRETMEETGLQPRIIRLVVVDWTPERRFSTFLGTLPHEVEPDLNWEHDAYAWCPLDAHEGTWATPSPLYAASRGRVRLARVLTSRDVVAAAVAACSGA